MDYGQPVSPIGSNQNSFFTEGNGDNDNTKNDDPMGSLNSENGFSGEYSPDKIGRSAIFSQGIGQETSSNLNDIPLPPAEAEVSSTEWVNETFVSPEKLPEKSPEDTPNYGEIIETSSPKPFNKNNKTDVKSSPKEVAVAEKMAEDLGKNMSVVDFYNKIQESRSEGEVN